MKKQFSGTVMVKVAIGMKVRVNPSEIVGSLNIGKVFIIDSLPRVICGTEVVALNNSDGTRFSAAYQLSMLQITEV